MQGAFFRAGVVALAILALAGCAAPRPSDASTGAATVTPDLDWHTALVGGTVRVALDDPASAYRVEKIVLQGPAGQSVAAREMTRISGPGDLSPDIGLSGSYGSSSGGGIGVGVSVPLGGGRGSARAHRTLAVIDLPDAAAYRRTAAQWHIEATLRGPRGAPYHATIPAPQP